MEELARRESVNAEAAIPLVEVDSRLEPIMAYLRFHAKTERALGRRPACSRPLRVKVKPNQIAAR